VVSATKGDRIVYRKAVLACAGKSWHHVAFEYPQGQKRDMDAFITRAADALDHTENDGCDSVVSRQ
jgi:serine/threonine-protein kinase